MEATNYKTTRRKCFERIRGVCSQCGGPLSAIETVDNSRNPTFWAGCYDCSSFDLGTDPEHYRIASLLFDEGERPYGWMDRPKREPSNESERAYADYFRGSQVSGLCSLVRRVLFLAGEVV